MTTGSDKQITNYISKPFRGGGGGGNFLLSANAHTYVRMYLHTYGTSLFTNLHYFMYVRIHTHAQDMTFVE